MIKAFPIGIVRSSFRYNPAFAKVAPNMRSNVRSMKTDLQTTTANAPNTIKVINDKLNNGIECRLS